MPNASSPFAANTQTAVQNPASVATQAKGAEVLHEAIWTDKHSDGGPFYTESHFNQLIVEPFNAVSATLFFFLACAWFLRSRARLKNSPELLWTLVFLAVGGIGGTLYHAFRTHRLFHLMDVGPIALIGLGWSIYFLRLSFGISWYKALLLDVVLFASGYWALNQFPEQVAVSGQYVLLIVLVLGPLFLTLARHAVGEPRFLKFSVALFVVGFLFRIADPWSATILPMGTHWLWHAFCFGAVHNWLRFVASITPSQAQNKT